MPSTTRRRPKPGAASSGKGDERAIISRSKINNENRSDDEGESDKDLDAEIKALDKRIQSKIAERERQAAEARGEKVYGPGEKPPFSQLERGITAVFIGLVFTITVLTTEWFDQVNPIIASVAIWIPLMFWVSKNINPDDLIKELKKPLHGIQDDKPPPPQPPGASAPQL